ncbi:MAG: hypothetical protein HYX65_01340 [Gemmatimonadetes bacterium]|nr:hypothetical protein [Gemmatimonadota bacterium]
MSRLAPRRRLASVVALLIGATAGAAPAQRMRASAPALVPAPAAPTSSIRRSFDALQDSVRVAADEDAERRRREREVRRDTIRAGALIVAADPPWAGAAAVGAVGARARLEPLFGAERLARILDQVVIVVATQDTGGVRLTALEPEIRAVRGPVVIRGTDELPRDEHWLPHAIERWLVNAITAEISDHADRALIRWRELPTPDSVLHAQALSAAYVDLTFAASIPARRCFTGDTGGCAVALGIVPAPTVLDSLFTRDDRRALGRIRWRALHLRAAGSDTATNPCDAVPATPACERFVRGLPQAQWPAPMGKLPREVLIGTAFELGGAGAADRLLADSTAPLVARLERAAGVPRDSLLRVWQRRMIAARPTPMPLRRRDVFLALASVVVVAGAGLVRWSRP